MHRLSVGLCDQAPEAWTKEENGNLDCIMHDIAYTHIALCRDPRCLWLACSLPLYACSVCLSCDLHDSAVKLGTWVKQHTSPVQVAARSSSRECVQLTSESDHLGRRLSHLQGRSTMYMT